MQLLRQTEQKLWFADQNLSYFAGSGLALVMTAVIGFLPDNVWMRWFGGGFCFMFVVVFAYAALLREELTIDLANRSYERVTGMRPFEKTITGSLNEFTGVQLVTTLVKGDDQTAAYQLWGVNLVDYTGRALPSLMISTEELRAYQELERFARRFHLPAIDGTGTEEVVTRPEDLDEAARSGGLAGRRAAAGSGLAAASEVPVFLPLPWPTRIELQGQGPRKTIVVQPKPPDTKEQLRLLYHWVQLGIGAMMVAALPFLLPLVSLSNSAPTMAHFLWTGVASMVGPILLISSGVALWNQRQNVTVQSRIEDRGDRIEFRDETKGNARTAVIKKSEIRSVAIKPVLAGRGFRDKSGASVGDSTIILGRKRRRDAMDLEIRTDTRVHHCCDQCSREELEWLRKAVTTMVRYQLQ